MLLHVEDAVEALPAVVAAEGLFAGVLCQCEKGFMKSGLTLLEWRAI